MSYSDVTDKIERDGFDKTFLDLFSIADAYAEEVDNLEKKLKTAIANRGDAAANLEYLTLCCSRRTEFDGVVEREGQNLIIRVVYKDWLYILEIIPQENNTTLRKWNRYPVTVIPNE